MNKYLFSADALKLGQFHLKYHHIYEFTKVVEAGQIFYSFLFPFTKCVKSYKYFNSIVPDIQQEVCINLFSDTTMKYLRVNT